MALDKIKPLKMETPTDGTEFNFGPTETDPSQDYLSSKGVALENSDIDTIDLSADQNVQMKSAAGLLFSKTVVPEDTKIYKVSAEHQLLTFNLVTVNGHIQIDGDLVVFE